MNGEMNLNTASRDELATLPGIGPALAARIVAHRERSGPFDALEDLRQVSGVTERIVNGIRDRVQVGPGEETPERGRGGRRPPKDNGGYDDGGDGEDQVGPGKHHGGDPVRIHEEYVRRHLGGETPATVETYERAREQFRRLPGAVQRPPTELRSDAGEERPGSATDEDAQ